MKAPATQRIAGPVLATVLLLLLLEGGARLYERRFPVAPVDFAGGFDGSSRVFVPEEKGSSWMILNPRKAQIFYDRRFQKQRPPGGLRIVFMGESSVHRLHEELQELEAQLQRELGARASSVEVFNLGAPSYGSQRLAIVAKEMVEYQPDLLLIYMGHNEFEEVEQFHLILPGRAAFLEWAFHSAFARVALDLWVGVQVRLLERHRLSDRPNFDAARRYPFRPSDIQERMDSFRRNLEYIVGLYKARGIPVILGTVPSNLIHPDLQTRDYQAVIGKLIAQGKFAEARKFGGDTLISSLGRHQSSPLENQIIRETARKFEAPLVDVEKAIIEAEPNHVPGTALFADNCHLNGQGNRILLREYEKAIHAFLETWTPR